MNKIKSWFEKIINRFLICIHFFCFLSFRLACCRIRPRQTRWRRWPLWHLVCRDGNLFEWSRRFWFLCWRSGCQTRLGGIMSRKEGNIIWNGRRIQMIGPFCGLGGSRIGEIGKGNDFFVQFKSNCRVVIYNLKGIKEWWGVEVPCRLRREYGEESSHWSMLFDSLIMYHEVLSPLQICTHSYRWRASNREWRRERTRMDQKQEEREETWRMEWWSLIECLKGEVSSPIDCPNGGKRNVPPSPYFPL